jgi:hypothetical protein
MPQPRQIVYNPMELAEVMIKDNGIHEGHWYVCIGFQSNGGNFAFGGTPYPGLLTVVPEIGIQRSLEPTPLTVDAGAVNPIQATESVS